MTLDAEACLAEVAVEEPPPWSPDTSGGGWWHAGRKLMILQRVAVVMEGGRWNSARSINMRELSTHPPIFYRHLSRAHTILDLPIYLHVFGLLEEAKIPGENPRRGNMQI